MIITNKRGQQTIGNVLSVSILGVIFLVIGLFIYAIFMPESLPYINMILAMDNIDPLTKFLFAAIPFMAVIAVIMIAIKN